jgi:hypothetical protein
MKGKSFSAKVALIGAVMSAISAVGCLIYGLTYNQYFDFVVILCLLAGAGLLAVYALIDRDVTEWCSLLGVGASGFGLGLFIANSYNVWADTFGNILQYGSITGAFNFFNSQGGPIPAVILILLGLIAYIFGIIACFSGKEDVK